MLGISESSQEVLVSIRATDNLSGVNVDNSQGRGPSLRLQYFGTGGDTSQHVECPPVMLAAGENNPLDARLEAVCILPRYSAIGQWSIGVTLYDNVNNGWAGSFLNVFSVAAE